MREHPFIKAVGALGAVVGLLTGVGTLIGWAASDSFSDALFLGVRVAGSVFFVGVLALGSVGSVWALATRDKPRGPRQWVAFTQGLGPSSGRATVFQHFKQIGFYAVPLAFFSGAIIFEWDKEWTHFAFGTIALLIGLIAAGTFGARQRQVYRESHRECPDCAEIVKSKARVCRHCGYRFQPPP